MKIIAKASFSFGPGVKRDGTVEKFVTVPGVIMEMPDKFANDDLFKDCVKYGLVNILGAQPVVETEFVAAPEEEEATSQDELDQFVAEVKGMNHDTLVENAEAAGMKLSGMETDKQLKKALVNVKRKELGL